MDSMEDEYMSDFKRMALALTSAQMAKDTSVKQFGIGEDLPTHFLGWSPINLVLVCQMTESLQKMSHEERLSRSERLCSLLRRYWWLTSLTMVAEGYCSLNSHKTQGMELSKAYLDPSLPIYECLTVSHVNGDDQKASVSMVAAPYRVELGKVVKWNEMLVYPENPDKHISPSRYALMLKKAMLGNMEENLNQSKMDEARKEVLELGFNIQEFI